MYMITMKKFLEGSLHDSKSRVECVINKVLWKYLTSVTSTPVECTMLVTVALNGVRIQRVCFISQARDLWEKKGAVVMVVRRPG